MNDGKKVLQNYYTHQPYGQSLKEYTHSSGIKHPSCGDSITIFLLIKNNQILNIGYETQGCMLSQAVTSLLASLFIEKSTLFVESFNKEELSQKIGLPLGPIRFKCALLALEAFQQACAHHA